MRIIGSVLAIALGFAVAFGAARVLAQEATPVPSPGPNTFITIIERAESVTITDLGEPGPSAGDLTAWGPNPLYDETNETDTGAVTQGTCQALNTAGDNHCIETIVFSDGSTIAVQGVQLGSGGPSTTTIVGGSGQYLHASGTLVVTASEDRLLWTKTLEIWQ